jgi:hypothetical protein
MTTKNHALYTLLMLCLIFPALAAAQANSRHPEAAAPAPSLQVESFQGQEVVAGEVLVKFRSVSAAMAVASPGRESAAMATAIARCERVSRSPIAVLIWFGAWVASAWCACTRSRRAQPN